MYNTSAQGAPGQPVYGVTGPDCPTQRDLYGEVAAAMRAQDMFVGAYYSKADWHSHSFWDPSIGFPTDRNVNYDIATNASKWQQVRSPKLTVGCSHSSLHTNNLPCYCPSLSILTRRSSTRYRRSTRQICIVRLVCISLLPYSCGCDLTGRWRCCNFQTAAAHQGWTPGGSARARSTCRWLTGLKSIERLTRSRCVLPDLR